MTVDTNKSAHITNATATPVVKTMAAVAEGTMKQAVGTCTCTAAAEAASTYRFCRVPSNAVGIRVLMTAADFTTAGAVDIGLYDTAENGGAVVDRDLFASAQVMTGGPHINVDWTNESGEYTVAEMEKPLWEVLGLSSDPNKWYDVTAYVTTAFDGGQTMHVKVQYGV